ncbi:MAG TPA: FCD domain-containing protein [Solirubrobacteraceae bacterium]|jgi:GntR family transcriptional repressor for pyruvate dehydrogenase complex|nr:FCD domain-containing protein [Solirubrobacteraceae bacterium]
MAAYDVLIASDPPLFAEVARADRLSDKVAHELTESILAGRLRVGDKLPSERELSEQFGVSRPVVREAVGGLKARGLLIDHPRRGHVVAAVDADAVSQSLTLYVRGRRVDYAPLLEVRAVLEVSAAGIAAERATPEQVDALTAAEAKLTPGLDADAAALADVEFHRAIAATTGNDYFVLLIDSLRDVLLDAQRPTLADPKIVATARRAHRKILRAIQARDGAAARRAMQAHLDLAGTQMEQLLRAGEPAGDDGAAA